MIEEETISIKEIAELTGIDEYIVRYRMKMGGFIKEAYRLSGKGKAEYLYNRKDVMAFIESQGMWVKPKNVIKPKKK